MRLLLPLLFTLLTLVCTPVSANSGSIHNKAEYRDAWCKGQTDVILPNGSRADCITKNNVVEVEFAPKWNEALVKVEGYAKQTGKKPAILVIIEKPADWSYYNKLLPIAQKRKVDVRYITPYKLQPSHETTKQ